MNLLLRSRLKLLRTRKKLSEKQSQAIGQQTQTIENQTRAIQQSTDNLNKNKQKSIKQGIQDYDENTNRNNQLLMSLVNSNQVDSSIVKTVSNLLNDKNESQFSLEPVRQSALGEGSPNLFTINPSNPQQVPIKGSTLTFLSYNNMYNLNDPDLSNFITNTQIDKIPQNINLIYFCLNDMKYDITYEDKKLNRYSFIKRLLQPQLGSGLNFVFLLSDPDELVDQLKLIVLEKVGGNDNPMLSEQIVAITDKLLQYQGITTNQHQNLMSTFTKKDQFVE